MLVHVFTHERYLKVDAPAGISFSSQQTAQLDSVNANRYCLIFCVGVRKIADCHFK